MLLRINYEELQALNHGVDLIVDAEQALRDGGVATLSTPMALEVDDLRDRLDGDISVQTLADQMRLHHAVTIVCEQLQESMDEAVIAYHPAHEEAIIAYFAYGYARAVLDRLEEMGDEMHAIIEVMTGRPADPRAEEEIHFPD